MNVHPIRRVRPSLAPVPVVLACAALALGACTSTEGAGQSSQSEDSSPTASAQSAESAAPSQSASSPSAATPTPSGTPSDEVEATSPIDGSNWTTSAVQRSSSPAEGDSLVFHDLRVAEHGDFYRVVVEFAGQGSPGWNVTWADKPIEQGRGRELPVEGSSYLDISISGTAMPTGSGQQDLYYSGTPSLTVGPLDAYEDGTFEDLTHLVIGMDKVREFQVGSLSDPVRVVIDVRK